MMKKILTIVIVTINAFATMAQKNHVKIGGGFGSVPYEDTPGWNVAVIQNWRKI